MPVNQANLWGLIAVIVLIGAGAGVVFLARPDSTPLVGNDAGSLPGSAQDSPRYVGRKVCAECHADQKRLWRGSHHDLAMQAATGQTVLGDFKDATYTYYDVTSTFSRKDGKFLVRTDGADGRLHTYEIAYTFGIYPLQQYLIAFPDGRVQALNVCWDTRPKEAGGQRWFHLYPDEEIRHDDVLHWTGPYQNWNHMCAECHSTNVRKNYDLAADQFAASWSEINVSCEACHGPGSNHVEWARAIPGGDTDETCAQLGLVINLKEPRPVTWVFEGDAATAKREPPRTSPVGVEMCARCHSRRDTFSEDYLHGRPLADTHRLALLESTLFEFDGQIKKDEEVYEYQSFQQSKMYAAGVTCIDCHNPHTLKMPLGNAVCASCHRADHFDTPAHHFHAAESAGSLCVACHAPSKNYMVIHARHDHSFRIPRPDLTLKIGVPNACNQCHADQSAQWAVEATLNWWGPMQAKEPHYGEVLAAAHRGLPGAERSLVGLIHDDTQSALVRASAVALLGDLLGITLVPVGTAHPTLVRALRNPEPMVRAAAIDSLRAINPADWVELITPLLNDDVRFVRIDAARALAAAPKDAMTAEQKAALRRGLVEYRQAQLVNADRAEAHLNLGALSVDLGQLDEAVREYKTAIRLSPHFSPAYVNLADLYRIRQQDDQAERALRAGLELSPNDAGLHHALGLTLARRNRLAEAVSHLEKSVALAVDNARYTYVYGVALHSTGEAERAMDVLEGAHRRHPSNRDILIALATFCRDAGDSASAVEFAAKLVELAPEDAAAGRLLEELRAMIQ